PTRYETGVTLRWLWGDVKRLLYVAAGPPPGCPEPYPSILQGLREVLGPQPHGTRSETWSGDDRWPAVGEWVQGVGDVAGAVRAALTRRYFGARSGAAARIHPAPPAPPAAAMRACARPPRASPPCPAPGRRGTGSAPLP